MRLPNAWTVAAIAAGLGAAAGGGLAVLDAAMRPWRAGNLAVGTTTVPQGDLPVVEVPESRFDFGSIGAGAKGTHEFVIRNVGTAALELTRGATSCTCTVSDFEKGETGPSGVKRVAPGTSTKLRVEWRGKGDSGPFRQQASVLTNDPRQPQITFVVEGTLVPTFKAIPPSIALPRMTATVGQHAAATIFTFGEAPPTVESLTVTDEKTANFYTLSSRSLEASEYTAEKAATGGVRIDVDIRPGLPLGSLRQSIRCVLRIPEEVMVDIPLEGTVTGDISVAGASWDAFHEALTLGTVSSRTGCRAELFLTVKGPHRESVKPVVRHVTPESLMVDVGEAKPVGGGNVLRIPLSITIPPGSPAANHVCSQQAPSGKIILDTGHPDSPTLTLRVCVTIIPENVVPTP